MKKNLLLLSLISAIWVSCSVPSPNGCFPEDKLPDYITPLTDFGQRSEWSLDGTKVFFVDSAGGDAWMVDIKTKKPVKITKPEYRPEGHGYYRIVMMANGDLLLTCGPERHTLYFQVLDKSLKNPPVTIDEPVDEGPAVSRKNMKIAWTPHQKEIWIADVVYKNNVPAFKNKKKIVDNTNVVVDGVKYEDILEPQNFRPPEENELIWSQYGNDERGVFTSETMGVDLQTGKLVNYSKAPGQYDEPEGIFPDGEYSLIECDRHERKGTSHIDIYKLKLDGTGKNFERLTYFSNVEGYRSSNPVVRDDGKMMAFQASVSGSAAGAGCGIYLFDFEKFNREKNLPSEN